MRTYHGVLAENEFSMVARHYRIVEPSIVFSAEKALTDTLGSPADRNCWSVRI